MNRGNQHGGESGRPCPWSSRPAASLGLAALLASACGSSSPAVLTPTGLRPPPAFGGSPAAGAAHAQLGIAGPEASPITFERMSRWPEPGGHVPRAVEFSPDGKWVTFLQSEKQDEENALFVFDRVKKEIRVLLRAADLAKEAGTMSREEELRRERQRQRIKGITAYHWAKRAPVMVIPSGGDVFVRQSDGKIVKLTNTPDPEIDAKPCDTGERVAFVRKGELFTVDIASNRGLSRAESLTGRTAVLRSSIDADPVRCFVSGEGLGTRASDDRAVTTEGRVVVGAAPGVKAALGRARFDDFELRAF